MTETTLPATRRIEVLALACTTSVAITLATGFPIVRIVARAEEDSRPRDAGLEGWAILPFDAEGAGPWPAEVRVLGGRLALDVPSLVSVGAFQARLHEALARFRFRIVEDPYHVEMSDGALTLPLPHDERRFRAISGEALFAIDPTHRMPLVARLALVARRAAIRDPEERRA